MGKSSILIRLTEDAFFSSTMGTIGIDFKIKTMNLDGKNIKTIIWDTSGSERFRTITASYYRGAHGLILVYDCTSFESFENITHWLKQVE